MKKVLNNEPSRITSENAKQLKEHFDKYFDMPAQLNAIEAFIYEALTSKGYRNTWSDLAIREVGERANEPLEVKAHKVISSIYVARHCLREGEANNFGRHCMTLGAQLMDFELQLNRLAGGRKKGSGFWAETVKLIYLSSRAKGEPCNAPEAHNALSEDDQEKHPFNDSFCQTFSRKRKLWEKDLID